MLTEVTTVLRGVRPLKRREVLKRRMVRILMRAMGSRSHLDTCETLKPEDYAHAVHDIPLEEGVVKLFQELRDEPMQVPIQFSEELVRDTAYGIILIDGGRHLPNRAPPERHVCVMHSDLTSFVAREGWTIENRRAGHLVMQPLAADVFILVSSTPSDLVTWLECPGLAPTLLKPGL